MYRKSFLTFLGFAPFVCNMNNLNSLYAASKLLPNSERMPVLFLGHGNPMNAIEDNEFVQGFKNIAKTLPTPKAILCVSAHWYTKGTMATAMEMPQTIHDFGGFPKELFDFQYPAKGDPALAKEAKELLLPATIELDEKWGLDHGAWSVITHLYPDASIPVIQLSIDYTKPARYHYELAQKLSKLRNKGILIIGSGNIVHNLSMADFGNFDKDNYGYDWAFEAQETINKYLVNNNFEPLIEYDRQSIATFNPYS